MKEKITHGIFVVLLVAYGLFIIYATIRWVGIPLIHFLADVFR